MARAGAEDAESGRVPSIGTFGPYPNFSYRELCTAPRSPSVSAANSPSRNRLLVVQEDSAGAGKDPRRACAAVSVLLVLAGTVGGLLLWHQRAWCQVGGVFHHGQWQEPAEVQRGSRGHDPRLHLGAHTFMGGKDEDPRALVGSALAGLQAVAGLGPPAASADTGGAMLGDDSTAEACEAQVEAALASLRADLQAQVETSREEGRLEAKLALEQPVQSDDVEEKLQEAQSRLEQEVAENVKLEAANQALQHKLDLMRIAMLRERLMTPIVVPQPTSSTGPPLESGPPAQAPQADSKHAFVMMAHDLPDKPFYHLWGVVAVARMIQKLSAHPLLVLCNATQFPDGSEVAGSLAKLNAKVIPVVPVKTPRGERLMYERWDYAWWKLQIWTLTEYEKLIWLDSDTLIYRNVDYLFDRSTMWAQRDNWFCSKEPQVEMCSGIMLIFPNVSDFHGLLEFAERPETDLSKGDQRMIHAYFNNYTGRPIQLMSELEATFGRCIGQSPTFYTVGGRTPIRGPWTMPSFVHKSGGQAMDDFNVCFQHDVSAQLYQVGSATTNVCHYHPMGAVWRTHFCEAVALMGLQIPSARVYCQDSCWWGGQSAEGVQCGPLSPAVQTEDLPPQDQLEALSS